MVYSFLGLVAFGRLAPAWMAGIACTGLAWLAMKVCGRGGEFAGG